MALAGRCEIAAEAIHQAKPVESVRDAPIRPDPFADRQRLGIRLRGSGVVADIELDVATAPECPGAVVVIQLSWCIEDARLHGSSFDAVPPRRPIDATPSVG